MFGVMMHMMTTLLAALYCAEHTDQHAQLRPAPAAGFAIMHEMFHTPAALVSAQKASVWELLWDAICVHSPASASLLAVSVCKPTNHRHKHLSCSAKADGS